MIVLSIALYLTEDGVSVDLRGWRVVPGAGDLSVVVVRLSGASPTANAGACASCIRLSGFDLGLLSIFAVALGGVVPKAVAVTAKELEKLVSDLR
ncbi:hypothetical protein H045_12375 [Pseudomonas poae RE*1-1-14]|nr:hypothetical protein H045_12375 [Pseudomonas poae RE*1-1-14]